jgi:hypothetical protein
MDSRTRIHNKIKDDFMRDYTIVEVFIVRTAEFFGITVLIKMFRSIFVN